MSFNRKNVIVWPGVAPNTSVVLSSEEEILKRNLGELYVFVCNNPQFFLLLTSSTIQDGILYHGQRHCIIANL